MLAHKLVLDDDDSPFKLIAIHCSLEGYRLAFFLNEYLRIRLGRTREEKDHDLVTKTGTATFALYTYNNRQEYRTFFLIGNKSYLESQISGESGLLFAADSFDSRPVYLLPQYRSVDFLLKIEEEGEYLFEMDLLEKIKQIPGVSTAYSIATDQLKFKENLIFD